MIEIYSYIKHNDLFYRIDDCDIHQQKITNKIDWNYVEGGIQILYYGSEVLGLDCWDDINWFWGFVAHNFQDYFEKGEYSTYMPDQPIKFVVKDLARCDDLLLKIYSDTQVYTNVALPKKEFLLTFLKAGIEYFEFEKHYHNSADIEIKLLNKLIDLYL